MANIMEPQPGDTTISIPITFDYRGGRQENSRNKFILSAIVLVVQIILIIGLSTNGILELWQKVVYDFGIFYIGLLIIRFVGFNELYFSDMYETLLERDFNVELPDIWQIFDIDFTYPYICYYKNGMKGIFVKMEKDTITGKPDDNQYLHSEAISEAYNLAHSLNMDIVNIDYMDNVGNDPRLQTMYDNLSNVTNPDMQDLLTDIYENLQSEMSRNYSCFDVYLFLTRDLPDNFLYNVQNVTNTMLGGNFITYRILSRVDINILCKAIFNLYDFSIIDACGKMIESEVVGGIVPVKVKHSDGTLTVINKTQNEMKKSAELEARRRKEEKEEYLRNRHELRREKRSRKKSSSNDKDKRSKDEDLELF